MIRPFFVWLHRWSGLVMAAFLIVVGLTGSLLAFNVELERVFAPQLFAAPRPGVARLDLATLAERAEAMVPRGRVVGITFTEPDQASVYFTARDDLATGKPYDLDFTEFFLDPWTGEELGRRRRGDLSQGLINLMPFIYELHWTLAIGSIGQWTLGVVALIWTLDCFNGFYLTLPLSSAGFWRRWKSAWLVKRHAGFYRLNFDLHRAGGLWLWAMLFIFGWSSVMMNIRPFVFDPVMRVLFDYRSPMDSYMALIRSSPPERPALGWREALTAGERLMAAAAVENRFTAGAPQSLSYSPEINAYLYSVHGSRDLFERSPKGGGTSVLFDGDTSALVELSQPTGEHSGNTVESWLYALHMARVFGMPYRIFVCALGLVIAMLSVTGVYIWWKKRRARKLQLKRDARGGAAATKRRAISQP
jgi:uncharacterized iron-regulated membrane protein